MSIKIRKKYDKRIITLKKSYEPTLTQQHFADTTNINKIMSKYRRTGILPETQSRGSYGDYSSLNTYHDTLNRLRGMRDQQQKLPKEVKDMLKTDDPEEVIKYLIKKEQQSVKEASAKQALETEETLKKQNSSNKKTENAKKD